MSKFVYHSLIIFILSIISAEIITRYFNLRSDNLDIIIENSEGYYSYLPNSSGIYTFGKFPNLHRSVFRINDIGFNSILDFKDLDSSRTNIAFVGDSFVEAFHVDIRKSFSGIIMDTLPGVQSYDFGFAGYNIFDFDRMYRNYNLNQFDIVFILVDEGDFRTNIPGRRKFNSKKEEFRKLYNNFHFFQYLNVNHNIINSLTGLFSKFFATREYESNLGSKDYLHLSILKSNNVVFVTRDLQSFEILNSSTQRKILISHIVKPYTFGLFDEHYNYGGRINTVNTVIPLVLEQL